MTEAFGEVAEALEDILVDNVYGLESDKVVVEERLVGEEITLVCMTDGEDVVVLGHVLNHPRLHEGDRGPPTGGMGQVSPAPQLDSAFESHIMESVLRPTVREMAERGAPLRGALFVDFMLVKGVPYAIDYNVRFGDPATQTVLSAYSGDIYQLLQACRGEHDLRSAVSALSYDSRPRVSVVLACEGYPERYVRGDAIRIERAV